MLEKHLIALGGLGHPGGILLQVGHSASCAASSLRHLLHGRTSCVWAQLVVLQLGRCGGEKGKEGRKG